MYHCINSLHFQDLSEKISLNNPKLYIAGQQNQNFNVKIFVLSLLRGIAAAIMIFFVLFGITFLDVMPVGGSEWDYQSFGVAASAALTFVVNLQVSSYTHVLYIHCCVSSELHTVIHHPITTEWYQHISFLCLPNITLQVV